MLEAQPRCCDCQARAFEHVARHTPSSVAAERVLRVISDMGECVGSEGLVGGQVVDLECEGAGGEAAGIDTLRFIHEHKTARLLESAVTSGAVIGAASEGEVEQLRRYAEDVAHATRKPLSVWRDVGTAVALRFRSPGLEPGISYGFRIKCRNEKGWSLWSEPSVRMWTRSGPPDPVHGLEYSKVQSRTIVMDWRVPLCNGEQIFEYEVLHHAHVFHPNAIAKREREKALARKRREAAGLLQDWVRTGQEVRRRGPRCARYVVEDVLFVGSVALAQERARERVRKRVEESVAQWYTEGVPVPAAEEEEEEERGQAGVVQSQSLTLEADSGRVHATSIAHQDFDHVCVKRRHVAPQGVELGNRQLLVELRRVLPRSVRGHDGGKAICRDAKQDARRFRVH